MPSLSISHERAFAPIIDEAPRIGKFDTYLDTSHHELQEMLSAWDEEARILHETTQKGQATQDGLGLQFSELTLFHGSDTAQITELQPAEEHTFGYGLYATSVPRKAAAYALAHGRGNEDEQPTVYEVKLEGVTFFDARNVEHRDEMLINFADTLEQELEKELPFGLSREYANWLHGDTCRHTIPRLIENIRSKNINEVHGIGKISHVNRAFTAFLENLGYNGLIISEHEHKVGPHDSYVVFKPEKAAITKEVPINWFVKTDVEALEIARAAIAQRRKDLNLGWWEKLPEEESA